MKTFLVAFAVASLVVIGFVGMHAAAPPTRGANVATSQIYIHGTPVCVMKHGEAIVARVGECESLADPGRDGPFHGDPGGTRALPPGHPPIPDGTPPDGSGRRVPI